MRGQPHTTAALYPGKEPGLTALHPYLLYCCDTHIYIGHAVVQLVEALRYKPEGRGFNSRLCNWNFSLIYPFRSHYGIGVDSARNRNEYHEYFLCGKGGRCVGLTNLPLHVPVVFKSGSLKLLETSGPVQGCNGTDLPIYICTQRSADKSLARPGNKQGRKHVRRRVRFQQHQDASCGQVFSPCNSRLRRKFTQF